jgi:putative membrane protein
MKSASIWAVALAATLTVACADNGANDDTAIGTDRTAGTAADRAPGDTTPATSPGGAPMASANNAADEHRFIEKMGQVGVAEVKLGQLAAERASNAQVKQFGRRMAADHQKANEELKQVATKVNAPLPTEMDQKQQELYDRLSKMKGAEFDREYMEAMVDGHEEVAQELERHSGNRAGERSVGTAGESSQANASVSAWAAKTLPDVRQHHEQARQIVDKLPANASR